MLIIYNNLKFSKRNIFLKVTLRYMNLILKLFYFGILFKTQTVKEIKSISYPSFLVNK